MSRSCRSIHSRQAPHDLFARQMRDVEPDAPARRPASLSNLRVACEGDTVTGRELETRRVVAGHEPLAECVAKDPSFTPRRLGHERPRGILRFHEPGRVELDELGIADPGSGLHGETPGVAKVLFASRGGAAPDPRMPAGGENDGVGVDAVATAVLQIEAVRTEHDAIAHEESRDVDRVENRDPELRRAMQKRALDLEPRVVAGERGAAPRVRAEEALGDPSVLLSCEAHAIAFEILDTAGRSLGHDPHDARVAKEVALGQRVGGVLLPGVRGIHRCERGVDAAGGEGRVRVDLTAPARDHHAHAALPGFDRGAESGPPGADDEDVRRDPLFKRRVVGRHDYRGAVCGARWLVMRRSPRAARRAASRRAWSRRARSRPSPRSSSSRARSLWSGCAGWRHANRARAASTRRPASPVPDRTQTDDVRQYFFLRYGRRPRRLWPAGAGLTRVLQTSAHDERD